MTTTTDHEASRDTTANGATKSAKAKKTAPGSTDIEEVELSKVDVVEGKNPRKSFNKTKLDELAASIESDGLLEPMGLEPNPDAPGRYILLWGERRFRACKQNKMKTAPFVVRRDFAPVKQDASRFIENLQREALEPLEEAEALNAFMTTHGLTAKQVSETLNVKPSYISQRLTLLKMPKEVQAALSSGAINFTQARELARMEGSEAVATLQGMTPNTRAADIKETVEKSRIAKGKEPSTRGRKATAETPVEAPNIQRETLEVALEKLNKFSVSLRPKNELKDGLEKVYYKFTQTKSEQKKEQYRGALTVLEWALGIRETM